MIGFWNGTIYSSGTITGNGNSGVIDLAADIMGLGSEPLRTASGKFAITRAWLILTPSDLATDETLDVDLNVSWDSSGTADLKVHDFTQVTSSNAAERLLLPGGESVADTLGSTPGTDLYVPMPIAPFWKFSHTLGGSSKSMAYTITGFLRWEG
jgi:hypothetical protein